MYYPLDRLAQTQAYYKEGIGFVMSLSLRHSKYTTRPPSMFGRIFSNVEPTCFRYKIETKQ